MNERTKYYDGE